MVMPSLSMYSVSCSLQRRSGNRPSFVVYFEVSYTLQQLPPTMLHYYCYNNCYYILKKEAQMANLWPENTMADTKSEVQHSCLSNTPGMRDKVPMWMYTVLYWRRHVPRR